MKAWFSGCVWLGSEVERSRSILFWQMFGCQTCGMERLPTGIFSSDAKRARSKKSGGRSRSAPDSLLPRSPISVHRLTPQPNIGWSRFVAVHSATKQKTAAPFQFTKHETERLRSWNLGRSRSVPLRSSTKHYLNEDLKSMWLFIKKSSDKG
jgi:hypothetical protein